MKGFLLVCIIIALIVLTPLASIWALNTLFPVLAIPYNFWTWLAVLIIEGMLKSQVKG